MAAFLRAEMAGLDGVETDLRTTADRKVVLFHDRTVAGRAVANCTHADLVGLSGVEVPLLEDVLDRDWRLAWNFEFKTTASVELALPILHGAVPHGTIFSSFIHSAVRTAVAELGGEGALLMASRPVFDTLLPVPSPRIRSVVWDWNVSSPDLFEDAAGLGWANMVYGPETQEEHDALAILRPRIVITNHPEMARRALGEIAGEI
jgi:glycerophosphoryl diester phosphodiesterase